MVVSCSFLRRRMFVLAVCPEGVLHLTIPLTQTASSRLLFCAECSCSTRFQLQFFWWTSTEWGSPTLPEKGERYLARLFSSIFFAILRRDAPNRVPYFPTIPTFFVLFDIFINNNNPPQIISSVPPTYQAPLSHSAPCPPLLFPLPHPAHSP